MTTTTETATRDRSVELATGLRAMADMVEARSELVPIVAEICSTYRAGGVYIDDTDGDVPVLLDAFATAAAAHGAIIEGSDAGAYHVVCARFGGVFGFEVFTQAKFLDDGGESP